MKGRNRNAGVEKEHVGIGREGENGTNWDKCAAACKLDSWREPAK